ncbi:Cof-type HAD-IIB family hydrolase [Kosmotoga sp. DU53]|uniref:Cof-type HAD-IIB family hydrolase n=1 Tax=Kosmotoga sp. DU53 TaxID=1310160 RepID=UPI00059D8E0F|nr:Cof-type HAD-IIB family hydrolase [Kosmotoga sp. DU53]OAA20237.1 hypothetical protein DU53_08865 [Kosmotoga sp. DU53]
MVKTVINGVVIDIDGTFIDSEEKIPIENLEVFRELEAKGLRVIFASGRMLTSVKNFISKISDKAYPIIAYNGAVVYVNGENIFNQVLLQDTAVRIVERALSNNMYIQAYVDDRLVVPKDCEEARSYASHSGVDFMVVEDLTNYLSKHPTIKLLMIAPSEQIDNLRLEFSEIFPEVDFVRSFSTYLDIVPKGVSKGKALEILCKHLEIDIGKLIAFGDNDNDISLFERCGFSIAMANATQRAKKAADVIAPSNDEAGFARVMKKLLTLCD